MITTKQLIEWAKTKPVNYIVGRAADPHCCPFSNCNNELTGQHWVFARSYAWLDNKSVLLPKDVQDAIIKIDNYFGEGGYVKAGRLVEILLAG